MHQSLYFVFLLKGKSEFLSITTHNTIKDARSYFTILELTEGFLFQVKGLKYTTVTSTAGQYNSGTFYIQLQVIQQDKNNNSNKHSFHLVLLFLLSNNYLEIGRFTNYYMLLKI